MRYPSRLARRYERLNRQQSYLLLVGAAVLLIIFVMFGFPAILNLSSTISSLRRGVTQTVQDKGVAPAVPRLAQTFDATNSASIKLTGIADPKVTVQLFQNDQPQVTTIASDDGTFSFSVIMARGDNMFTVQAVSSTGVKSNRPEVYRISYLDSLPKLEITTPKDGETVKEAQVTIVGKTDPEVSVTVNDRLAIVKNDGSYSAFVNLASGDNKIKVTVTDRAGNQTTKEIIVKYNP